MEETISILITGDFYGGNQVEKLIQEENFSTIFSDLLPLIRTCDISVTNLEAPLTTSTLPIVKTGPCLKSTPKTAEALKFAGFNLVTLANNHIMDFGETGLTDTLSALNDVQIKYVGVGNNSEEASKACFYNIKGKKLAFINITENEWSTTDGNTPGANSLNPIKNYYSIKTAKSQSDFLFVIVHGGNEMYPLPSPRIKELYRFFIDCGANAIIGHHSHCFSGFEIYGGCPIFYSLGNFVFDTVNKRKSDWYTGFAVKFNIHGDYLSYDIIPYCQFRILKGIFFLNENERIHFNNSIEKLNLIISNDIILKIKFKHYCNSVTKRYKFYLDPHSNRFISLFQKKGLIPYFLTSKKKLLYKNLIRSESHRDVLLKIL